MRSVDLTVDKAVEHLTLYLNSANLPVGVSIAALDNVRDSINDVSINSHVQAVVLNNKNNKGKL
jgi:hypothetical protein